MALTLGKTTVAASGTLTYTAVGLGSNLYHTVTVTNTGTCTISMKHLDNAYVDMDTGVTAGTQTYVMDSCAGIKIVETGGANAVDITISSTEA